MPTPDLLHLLRDCYTQHQGQAGPNIVDAQIVRSATLTPDPDAPNFNSSTIPGLPPRYIAHITLHAPSSGSATDDTANAQLIAQIENRLLGLPSISRVKVTLLPTLFPIL